MARTDAHVRSLLSATDIDVLPDSTEVTDHGSFVAIRSPSHPTYYWGNYLLLREPPEPGSREFWEGEFERTVGRTTHRAFTWDSPDGALGAAAEFVQAGYDPEALVALIARPAELRLHPRASRGVEIHMLDPHGDDDAWAAAVELQVANRGEGHGEREHREFVQALMRDRRERYCRGDGAWFVARTPDGAVAAACGVTVVAGRARYQSVDTLEAYRRRGIATRLVFEAGRAASEQLGARQLVIAAEADYHALSLYESLGFVRRERASALCWWPGASNAAAHPALGHLAAPER